MTDYEPVFTTFIHLVDPVNFPQVYVRILELEYLLYRLQLYIVDRLLNLKQVRRGLDQKVDLVLQNSCLHGSQNVSLVFVLDHPVEVFNEVVTIVSFPQQNVFDSAVVASLETCSFALQVSNHKIFQSDDIPNKHQIIEGVLRPRLT